MTGHTLKDNPTRIYLEPGCVIEHGGASDRLWCEDDVWEPCGDCGAPAVEYLRANIAEEALEALAAMLRAHTLHTFSPRGQETAADRDTCRICGGNYRDTEQHITAREGHPSDVKAEAARMSREVLARATNGGRDDG